MMTSEKPTMALLQIKEREVKNATEDLIFKRRAWPSSHNRVGSRGKVMAN